MPLTTSKLVEEIQQTHVATQQQDGDTATVKQVCKLDGQEYPCLARQLSDKFFKFMNAIRDIDR